MAPEEFVAWLAPPTQKICKQYGLFASVCIAQGALKAGGGGILLASTIYLAASGTVQGNTLSRNPGVL